MRCERNLDFLLSSRGKHLERLLYSSAMKPIYRPPRLRFQIFGLMSISKALRKIFKQRSPRCNFHFTSMDQNINRDNFCSKTGKTDIFQEGRGQGECMRDTLAVQVFPPSLPDTLIPTLSLHFYRASFLPPREKICFPCLIIPTKKVFCWNRVTPFANQVWGPFIHFRILNEGREQEKMYMNVY